MPSPRPDGGGTRKRLGCSSSSGDGGCGGGGDSGGGGGPINVPISVPVRGAADAVVATMAVAATAVAAGGSGAGAGGRGGDGATAVVAVATVAAVARRRPCAQAGAAPCRLNKPVLKATLPTDHVDHLLHEAFWPHETCIGPMHMNRFVRAHAIPVRPHM